MNDVATTIEVMQVIHHVDGGLAIWPSNAIDSIPYKQRQEFIRELNEAIRPVQDKWAARFKHE